MPCSHIVLTSSAVLFGSLAFEEFGLPSMGCPGTGLRSQRIEWEWPKPDGEKHNSSRKAERCCTERRCCWGFKDVNSLLPLAAYGKQVSSYKKKADFEQETIQAWDLIIVMSNWLLDRSAIRFRFPDKLKTSEQAHCISKSTSFINVTSVIWSLLSHSARQKAIQPNLDIHAFWTWFMRSSKSNLFNHFKL